MAVGIIWCSIVGYLGSSGSRSTTLSLRWRFCMKASLLCGLAVVLGLAAVPALAHHSFAAEYDAAKPVTMTGTVTKVEWMNPHARFYIDMMDDAGKMTNLELELGCPNGLMR